MIPLAQREQHRGPGGAQFGADRGDDEGRARGLGKGSKQISTHTREITGRVDADQTMTLRIKQTEANAAKGGREHKAQGGGEGKGNAHADG